MALFVEELESMPALALADGARGADGGASPASSSLLSDEGLDAVTLFLKQLLTAHPRQSDGEAVADVYVDQIQVRVCVCVFVGGWVGGLEAF